MRVMARKRELLAAVAALSLCTSESAPASTWQRMGKQLVFTPGSSVAKPADKGQRAHTNVLMVMPEGGQADNSKPSSDYETPASLACVYAVVPPTPGCNPQTVTTVANGGAGTIVIVDAYDDPNIAGDLAVFSKQYGLPPITADNFQVVYATGSRPPADVYTGGWELEEALDVEMAHALAPNAKIVLVEAQSNAFADLFLAESVAIGIAKQPYNGVYGGVVSNSWGSVEFEGESNFEPVFSASGGPQTVTVFASTGDGFSTEFPAALPDVIAVGGTQINRNPNTGNYQGQAAWWYAGSGDSLYIPRPGFQGGVKRIVGAFRGTPDISFDSSTGSGVWVYDTFPIYQLHYVPMWTVVGGTSVASPSVAAIYDQNEFSANGFNANNTSYLHDVMYSTMTSPDLWTDITLGLCDQDQFKALRGYDLCTGVGTPYGTEW